MVENVICILKTDFFGQGLDEGRNKMNDSPPRVNIVDPAAIPRAPSPNQAGALSPIRGGRIFLPINFGINDVIANPSPTNRSSIHSLQADPFQYTLEEGRYSLNIDMRGIHLMIKDVEQHVVESFRRDLLSKGNLHSSPRWSLDFGNFISIKWEDDHITLTYDGQKQDNIDVNVYIELHVHCLSEPAVRFVRTLARMKYSCQNRSTIREREN